MGLLGPSNNEFTADDIRRNLEEDEMSGEEAALYGAMLAQDSYREGDMSREEFQEYVTQAEEVTVSGTRNVSVPEVEGSVERMDSPHFDQQEYDSARRAVSESESLEEVDLVAIPGPQNIGVGASMADELGVDYTLMIAEDEDTRSLGPNADPDSVRTIAYGSGGHDIELHGQDLEDSVTAVGGYSWGRNMTEADTFIDAPERLSDKAFRAVMMDGGVGSEIGGGKTLGQVLKDKLGF